LIDGSPAKELDVRTRGGRHAAAAIAAFGLIVVTAGAGSAQEPVPQEPLRLADLIAAVIAAHPAIAAAESRLEAASARPAQELSLPDPTIATGYTSAGRPYPGAGLGSEPNAQLSVMVSQAIPYPGKRELRAEVARREADAERHQVELARLGLTSRVKQAYYRLAAAHQLDAVLRQNQDLLATLLKVSESRYAVGQAAQQDVIRTQAQIGLLAVQRARIAAERRTREGEINALLNRVPGAPLGRPADLVPVTLARSLPSLVQLAGERSPMLQHEQSGVSIAQAAIDVATRDFKPDFAISGGYGYAGSMPDMFELRVDVVVPLQRARRRAAVAERRSTLAVARHTLAGARLDLQARLQEDYELAASAGELATLYRDAVLPQARLALESSLASYQTGTVDFLSVLTSFGAVLEYEMGYIEQLADLHVAASRLEEMAAVTLLP
jgi:outer membrane protein TolC